MSFATSQPNRESDLIVRAVARDLINGKIENFPINTIAPNLSIQGGGSIVVPIQSLTLQAIFAPSGTLGNDDTEVVILPSVIATASGVLPRLRGDDWIHRRTFDPTGWVESDLNGPASTSLDTITLTDATGFSAYQNLVIDNNAVGTVGWGNVYGIKTVAGNVITLDRVADLAYADATPVRVLQAKTFTIPVLSLPELVVRVENKATAGDPAIFGLYAAAHLGAKLVA